MRASACENLSNMCSSVLEPTDNRNVNPLRISLETKHIHSATAKDSGCSATQNPSPCRDYGSGLGGDEPLLKIRQDVIDVLDADSQSHQAGSHPGCQLVLRREL